jgi:hypothetical protein
MRGLSRERLQRTSAIRRFGQMAEPGQEVSSSAGSPLPNGSIIARLQKPSGCDEFLILNGTRGGRRPPPEGQAHPPASYGSAAAVRALGG